MTKFLLSLTLAILCTCGFVFAVPETVDHGAHGAEKHKALHFKGGKHNLAYDLDALLASENRDELAELPDDVKRKRLKVLAQSHDTNKNGMLEKEELFDWVLYSYKILDHQEATAAWRDDDSDGDGKLTFQDILKKEYDYSPEYVEEMEKKRAEENLEEEDKAVFQSIDEEKKRFDAADVNKDGVLTEDEFVPYFHPIDHTHMHAVEVEKVMKNYDENSDGFIQMEEFVKGTEDEDTSQFETLDKDKDGKLTADEFKPHVLLTNDEIAQDDVEHLLSECDENADGHLSIDEIVENEEEFLASLATDYGQHLHFVKDEL